jgi:hypothetical protein
MSPLAALRQLPALGRLAFLLACGWLVTAELLLAPNTYDDAYIIARYADRLAAGGGLTFNPGERVEGASSLSWVVVLAGARAAGIEPLVAAKAIGGALGVAVLAIELGLGAALGSAWVGLVAAGLTALSAPFAFWAVGGLETGFYAFLLTLALALGARDLGRRGGFPWGALPFAAALATRPEAPLLAAPYACLLLAGAARDEVDRRKALLAAGLLAAALAALTAFRLSYFGAPMPNTYYAKVSNPALWSGPAGAARYLASAFTSGSAWLLLVPAALPLLSGPRRIPLLLGAVFLCQLAFVLSVGGDWMLGARFLVPVLPAFHLLAAAGLAVLAAPLRARLGPRALAALAAVAALSVAGGALTERQWLGAGLAAYTERHQRAHIALGRWLRAAAPPGARIALDDCGAVPALSGLPAIDLLGLTDPFIARHAPEESALDLLERRRPELVVIASHQPAPDARGQLRAAAFPIDRLLVSHPLFWRLYRHQRTWLAPGDYNLHLYARADVTLGVPPAGSAPRPPPDRP